MRRGARTSTTSFARPAAARGLPGELPDGPARRDCRDRDRDTDGLGPHQSEFTLALKAYFRSNLDLPFQVDGGDSAQEPGGAALRRGIAPPAFSARLRRTVTQTPGRPSPATLHPCLAHPASLLTEVAAPGRQRRGAPDPMSWQRRQRARLFPSSGTSAGARCCPAELLRTAAQSRMGCPLRAGPSKNWPVGGPWR